MDQATENNPFPDGLNAAEAIAAFDALESGPTPEDDHADSEAPEETQDNLEDQELDAEGDEDSDEEGDEPESDEESEEDLEDDDESDFEGFEIEGEVASVEQILEWKASGLRQADYTRKTQEVAEQRKAVEAEQQQTAQLNQQYIDALEQQQIALHQLYQGEGFSDEDLAKVREDYGLEEYINRKEMREQRQQELGALFQHIEAAKQQQAEMEAQQKQQRLQESYQKIAEAIPDYADEEKGKALREGVAAILTSDEFGFSPTELDAIEDHRYFLVAHKLYEARQALPTDAQKSAAAKKASKKVSPVVKKGSPTSKKQRRAESKAKTLQQGLSGPLSVQQAAALFDQIK
jgi:hypothetical protein